MMMISTSDTVKFEPCPKCHVNGHKPVLARWPDGHAYCFWCNYFEKAPTATTMRQVFGGVDPEKTLPPEGPQSLGVPPMPNDTNAYIDVEPLTWLNSYGITRGEISIYNIKWSPMRQWLIFPYVGLSNRRFAWQARSFAPIDQDGAFKWKSFGAIHKEPYVIGHSMESLVLVEDIISAIKLARHTSVMPLFGSTIRMELLADMFDYYEHIAIWLDKDKERDAYRYQNKIHQLFPNVTVITSQKDPKAYNANEIKGFLTAGKVR